MSDAPSQKLKRGIDELTKKDEKKRMAVAVQYDVEKGLGAPKIIATGKGGFASEILKIAQENNIPIYEDPTLSEILAKLELDDEIPPELYTLVAEVLAFVYRLNQMAKKRSLLKRKFSKL